MLAHGSYHPDRTQLATPSDFEAPKTGASKTGPSPPKTPRGAKYTPRGKVSRGPKGGGFRGEVRLPPDAASPTGWGRSASVPYEASRGSPDVGAIPPMSARSSRHMGAPRAASLSSGTRSAWGADEASSRSARSSTPSSAMGGAFLRATAHTPVDQGVSGDSRWAMPVHGQHEGRSPSACSTKRPGGGGATGDLHENLKPGMVEAPWGARRANFDNPPWEEVMRRKQMYCDYLDSQANAKQDRKLQLQHEDKRIDMTTTTGLESRYHEWGSEAIDAVGERAVYKELLATADFKRRAANHDKDSERQAYANWRAEEDARFERMYAEKQERSRQERAGLATTWLTAAASRQSKEDADKADTLRAEQAHLDRIREGLVPARRMRRPKTKCLPEHLQLP